MDNKVLAAIFGGIALLCVTFLGVAFIVTESDDAPAEPTTTSAPSTPAPEPVETSDPIMDILEDTWNKQSYSDQQSLCWLFNIDPDKAFNAFDNGSEGLVPEDTFMEFFSGECATI